MKIRNLVLATLLTGCVVMTAQAQLLIGQITGLTGPIATSAKEALAGSMLYIDNVNSKGGVHGEKIELLVLDDKFDPKLSVEKADELIKQKNVLALFMNRGTAHIEVILPAMAQHGVPLIAPTSGAMVLRQPFNKLIFHLRASHQREAEKAIAHLKLVGVTQIAVVYVDDSFGIDILEGARNGFRAQQLTPAAIIKADRAKPDLQGIVEAVIKSNAQTVVWIGATTVVSAGVKALRAAGSGIQVVTMSNNASAGFIKLLDKQAQGVIVAQVFPSERALSYGVIREAQAMAKAAGVADLSPIFLEGYTGAKLLVEGLRRAGPKPTRQGLVKALETMRPYDLGGLVINYGPEDHEGLDFVELSIIGGDGKFKR
jgi:ABC-type branched-subunit amino acid transport system substrate-binding protein